MELIDGKKIREGLLADTQVQVASLGFQPVFCDILVGEDPVSAQYVRMKGKMAESIGIKFHNAVFPATITTEALINEIEQINNIPHMCGVIVQLPLPAGLDKARIVNAIDPAIDVDCLGDVASEHFYTTTDAAIGFPTALSCMALLDSTGFDLTDKKIVVIGQGELVGKPVTKLLRDRGLNPIIVVRGTENKETIFKSADVIISGTGRGKLITGELVKPGVILIDAGTSESNGGIVGDVDLESVKDIASFVSPVPGGVGPVTVAMLLKNVVRVAKSKLV